jgi:hypothetical protein
VDIRDSGYGKDRPFTEKTVDHTMTQSGDWRRAATADQMRSVVRTIDPSVAHIARIQDYWLGGWWSPA